MLDITAESSSGSQKQNEPELNLNYVKYQPSLSHRLILLSDMLINRNLAKICKSDPSLDVKQAWKTLPDTFKIKSLNFIFSRSSVANQENLGGKLFSKHIKIFTFDRGNNFYLCEFFLREVSFGRASDNFIDRV